MAQGSTYKIAVGLNYQDDQEQAPSLSLKAEQQIADQAVKLARRFGVPVLEKPELAQALNQLELDQEIPRQLFETVALVLARLQGNPK